MQKEVGIEAWMNEWGIVVPSHRKELRFLNCCLLPLLFPPGCVLCYYVWWDQISEDNTKWRQKEREREKIFTPNPKTESPVFGSYFVVTVFILSSPFTNSVSLCLSLPSIFILIFNNLYIILLLILFMYSKYKVLFLAKNKIKNTRSSVFYL